ncbi:MAG: hypothetical protein HKN23_15585 [Verrucomicrobiales bacterium]|nr:hypothetical protein [Verrucomicrobiales bacterium]
MKRNWPWGLALLGLVLTFFFSIRSWSKTDFFVGKFGSDGPYLMAFTICSCIRFDLTETGSSFSVADQDVGPSDTGWTSIPLNDEERRSEVWFGRMFENSGSDTIFFSLPIWLALVPFYIPLVFWLAHKRMNRV